ncbi:LacI family transcriptional regulator [Reticulibacter mediterranei]|uniref:LacI family transcriptional regulator n=1 Tax=Reticulibacter mediterranei TaxID=2778369 RepID=A0A8J3N0L8_9CHLR|nr:LacI family DNA-binding transcriptional regulator [Reticulibacter mediterranei]GHO93052.1 LacI family transcriptional regulator [Reticulibacter mediterranei]
MAGSVTIKDVASHAEVSVGTVSRVFNNHSNVTDEIRQRVLKAASELGYHGRSTPDNAARPPTRGLKEIGFLYYSHLDANVEGSVGVNPFWSHILHGAENEARKSNIKMTYRSIGDVSYSQQLLLSTIYDMRLGGILLVGPTEPEVVKIIQMAKLPLVLVDNYVPRISVDAVLCDNFEGGREAVEYLINSGHRQIAFIGGPTLQGPRPINQIYPIERRAAGYRTALLDAGIPVRYELYESGDLTSEGGYQACQRLLAKNIPCTAIFCANDSTAIGVLKALHDAGKSVPEDVSLIGFDDISTSEYLSPALTTIRVNKEALGSTAVKNLVARAADMDAVSVASILEVELVERDSVRRLTT